MDQDTTPQEIDNNTKSISQSLTHRTLDALLWTFSGNTLQAAMKLIVMAALARLLTPSDFGLVSAAMIIISFSEIFSLLGIAPAIVQHPNLEARHIRTGFTTSILFGLSLTGLLWVFAPDIAGFFRMPNLPTVLRALALVFPLHSISIISKALLRRELQFRWLAGLEVVSYLVGYAVVGVSLAMMDFGTWALVGATLTQATLNSVITFIKQPHSVWPQLNPYSFKELVYYGGGVTAGQMFNYLALKGDNFVVGRWLGAEALGLYGRSYNLMATSATFYNKALDTVLFPTLAKIQDDPHRLKIAYRRGISLVALITLPVSGVIYIVAPELINILLGPGWEQTIVPFQILVAGMLFRSGYKIAGLLAKATGAVYHLARRQAIYAVLVVVGAWIGQYWGLAGASFGTVVALTIHYILMAQLSLGLTSMTWRTFFTAHLPALFLAVITWIQVWGAVTGLRELQVPSAIVLLAAAVIMAATLLITLYLIPKSTYGKDGLWIVGTLTEYIPERLSIFRWLKKSIQGRLVSA